MARASKIRRLPKELLEQLHAMMDAGHTLDAITTHLKKFGADVSRSGIGRYVHQQEKVLENIRRSREAAEAIVGELGSGADEGKMGRALTQIVQSLAYGYIRDRADDPDAQIELDDLYKMAQTVRHATLAGRAGQDHEAKTREALRAKFAAEVRDKIKALGSARELKELSDAELERKIAELATA
jgi:hypothetical protein